MKVTFDPKADAVYISLVDEMPKVAWTYPCDPVAVHGMINLDFDPAGRLVGIEVLDASKKLPSSILSSATTLEVERRKRRRRGQPRRGASDSHG